MDYNEQIDFLYKDVPGFSATVKLIEKLKKKRKLRVLNFSHHDLDGISSAFILKRIFENHLGAKVVTKMPAFFKLWEEALTDELKKEGEFDILLISDKGTFEYYDEFLKHVEEVLIIDHHQLDGKPKNCTLFNPTVEVSNYASAASLLCNMLAHKLGYAEEIDDLAALIGCRGDFAFDPVEKTISDFATPFIEEMEKKFPLAFEVRSGRPTMYDIVDRSRTALINQIGEVLQVGTLAHLYKEKLKIDVDSGPGLVYDFLVELGESDGDSSKFTSIEDFLAHGPNGKILSTVFDQFKDDWDLLEKRSDNSVFIGELRGIGVYLVFAREVDAMDSTPFPAILPFVASTKLENMKRKGNHPHAMVVVFCPKERGVHISMRGGGGIINCGKMCFELSKRLQEIYLDGKGIGGGGHAKAAELLADKPIPTYSVMHEFLLMAEEMVALSKALDEGTADHDQIEKSKVLGLTS